MNQAIYQYQQRSAERRKKPFLKIIFWFFVLFLFLGISITLLINMTAQNPTEQSILTDIVSPLETMIDEATNKSELPQIIETILEDETGKYAVYIENLETGETYEKNADKQFASASLYKLWVMGETYDQLEQGRLSKSQEMKDEVVKINERFNIATEAAELKEGEISMTVDQALYDMIANSDNYSALLLSQTIKLSNVSDFMEKHGYNDSHLDPPTTTAHDIGTLYKQLYNKELINTTVSDEMMELLKDQTWNDRIPKYLPEDTIVAHKTGELDGVKHDAGIVFTNKGDYIIVLMSDTNSESHAAEVEAKISEAVYEYFTKD